LREIGVKSMIHVVHSGIPEKDVGHRPGREKDLIAYVGRVKTYKSIDHFIKAVALIREHIDVRAKIVGDGDALDALKALARKLRIPVDFMGFVSEEEKYRIYCTAQVIVQPSIKEGWGLTAIEAQSCGTPVVCADSPGLREVVVHERTGFLYEYGRVDQMADRIIELLEDQAKWRRFSSAARQWSGEFSWSKSAEKLEGILENEIRSGH
jgi:glycosyltransferase involved in cell wall biosynthesis